MVRSPVSTQAPTAGEPGGRTRAPAGSGAGSWNWRRLVRKTINRVVNVVDHPRLVLTYHRVCDLASDPDLLAVRPEHFARHLEIIARTAPVVPLDRLADTPGRAIAITFDDGYADNLQIAAPLLVSAGLPATVFVTAGQIGSAREFWWDEVDQLLAGPLPPGPLPGARETGEPDRTVRYASLTGALRFLTPDEIRAQLDRWWARAGRTPEVRPSHRPLDADEVARLARTPGIAIGGHTMRHPSLAQLDDDRLAWELTEARDQLRRISGQPVETMAYPFGTKRDVDQRVVTAVARAGYRVAVTTDLGQVHSRSHPLRWRRHTIRDWDAGEFAARLQDLWAA